MTKKTISHSSMSDYRACPQLHRFTWQLGYQPVREKHATQFGVFMHSWFAHLLSARIKPELRTETEFIEPVLDDPFERAKASAMLAVWSENMAKHDFEVLGVEQRIRFPLVNPDTGRPSQSFEVVSVIDAIVRGSNGVSTVEHKTTSQPITAGSDYIDRLSIDPQVSLYWDAAKHIGHNIVSCIYDVIQKPLIRPLKAVDPSAIVRNKDGSIRRGQRLVDETPDEYRSRCLETLNDGQHHVIIPVYRLENQLLRARRDVWTTANRMREDAKQEHVTRNPDACHRYGKCAFFGVCTGSESIEDPTLFRLRRNRATV